MRRRDFIAGLGGAAICPAPAKAQQAGRIPVIGVLWASDVEVEAPRRLPLLKGLAELGYVPGKTIIVEERYPNEVPERFDTLATELVNLKVDVLVVRGGSPIYAIQRATRTIPTVFVGVSDAVAIGLVSDISKPGGNISGITQMSPETSAKRLQLIQKVIPTISRVAILSDPSNQGGRNELSQLSAAARELGLSLEVFNVSTGNDIDQAFQKMEEQRFQAVMCLSVNLLISETIRISAMGLKHRLAVIGPSKLFVDVGALLSYGPDFPTLWHGAAYFVDKILKGVKVGDIPIQQPTKFDLSINLQTAKALGVELPPAMLAIADHVIE
jgi:putative tryptophan/tyrosine transport system substrate-binding protein